MPPRIFTVPEANRLIPRLEEVLDDLRTRRSRMEALSEKLQVLDALWGEGIREPANPDHGEYLELRKAIRDHVALLEETIQDEIVDEGIRFPVGALQKGLLDFPTSYRGRWVYLCWQVGEPEILQWHEINAGYAGRRDLTEEQARTMGVRDDPGDLDPSVLDF